MDCLAQTIIFVLFSYSEHPQRIIIFPSKQDFPVHLLEMISHLISMWIFVCVSPACCPLNHLADLHLQNRSHGCPHLDVLLPADSAFTHVSLPIQSHLFLSYGAHCVLPSSDLPQHWLIQRSAITSGSASHWSFTFSNTFYISSYPSQHHSRVLQIPIESMTILDCQCQKVGEKTYLGGDYRRQFFKTLSSYMFWLILFFSLRQRVRKEREREREMLINCLLYVPRLRNWCMGQCSTQ